MRSGRSNRSAEVRRGFLAVEPPPAALDAIEALVDGLRAEDAGLRWTTRAQWHVTLQFLGRVDDVDSLGTAVAESVLALGAFPVRLGGGGAFPKPAGATLLWLGLEHGADALEPLATAITGATARLGFAADDRRFRPHVTLARARARRDLRPLVDAIGDAPAGPEWSVREVVLFESDTRPDGARYTAINRFGVGS